MGENAKRKNGTHFTRVQGLTVPQKEGDRQKGNQKREKGYQKVSYQKVTENEKNYTAPIGAFFCPEIRAFTGFWGEISSTISKVLSDRKVLFKHKNGHQ